MKMTKEQLLKYLQQLAVAAKEWPNKTDGESPEGAHIKADIALLEYIEDEDIRKAFDNIDKWYA